MKSISQIFRNNRDLLDTPEVQELAEYTRELEGLVMDKKYLEKLKRNFLAQYLKGLKGNKKKIMQRINLYQVWWAMQVTSYNVVIWPTYQARKRIVRGLIPLAQRLLKKL